MKNPYLNEIPCPLSQPKTRKSEVAQGGARSGGARSGGAARCAETLDNIKGRWKGNLVVLVKKMYFLYFIYLYYPLKNKNKKVIFVKKKIIISWAFLLKSKPKIKEMSDFKILIIKSSFNQDTLIAKQCQCKLNSSKKLKIKKYLIKKA